MSNVKTVIVDYGLGNIFSIQRAIRFIGEDSLITDNHQLIRDADRIILPGVGAFGNAIKKLRDKELDKLLYECSQSGKFILGICLGMQLLMTSSEEFGKHEGLNIIQGQVVRFPEPATNDTKYKIPHVGWSRIAPIKNKNNLHLWEKTILAKSTPNDFYYFVHSYRVIPEDIGSILAVSEYGGTEFCSVIRKNSVFGCQFHPELSGEAGLNIYREFIYGSCDVQITQILPLGT